MKDALFAVIAVRHPRNMAQGSQAEALSGEPKVFFRLFWLCYYSDTRSTMSHYSASVAT